MNTVQKLYRELRKYLNREDARYAALRMAEFARKAREIAA